MLQTILLILVCWFLFAFLLGAAMGRVIRGFDGGVDALDGHPRTRP